MCPLRLILLFLSASLAGFFLLKNLKSKPEINSSDEFINPTTTTTLQDSECPASSALPISTKVFTAIGSGFWVCVDMASGKYLWRNLASSSAKKQL